ncbi:MAG: zinc-ribbon domain and TM2 domain-containing protein [Anaerovibrio sp.]|uniref:TM2 domain-containing protein n=1 Tax=Anaerovibrio sp. TaxID=1872532 RepID=UPI0025EB9D92|nr:zinc-ribbon domain and TM2 domain-containing protein [Anaerovibrio sp.]MCR5176115.1 zinc-ribbon domain and TM2 domain-containing protein [Anaerovibrio sp.]
MSKFCSNCGQELEDSATFCHNCGIAVGSAPAKPMNGAGYGQTGQQASYGQYGQPGQYGQGSPYGCAPGVAWSIGDDKKLVNKVAYGLLGLLLGHLGIHKFYAGKTMWGIIYLVFCWTFIPGLLGIVEGILGLVADSDVNGNIYA